MHVVRIGDQNEGRTGSFGCVLGDLPGLSGVALSWPGIAYGGFGMSRDELLRTVADTCRDVVRDAESGISTCRRYEDAVLIGWMHTHQLIGLRRLMLPLADTCGATSMSESIFDSFFSDLELVKIETLELLKVSHGPVDPKPATTAAVP